MFHEKLPTLEIALPEGGLDPAALFPGSKQVAIEIGYGGGEHLVRQALTHPDTWFVGCEVFSGGIAKMIEAITAEDVSNVRLFTDDALKLLVKLPAASLSEAWLLYPDPWPKSRHHKRRLIQPAFVELAASRLAPGAYLHVATDWQEYAEHVLEVLRANPSLANTVADFAPRPATRPETKFERRGLKLGHGVWDIVFTRKP